jgi:DNA-binding transcriptional MerR regulator
VGEPWRRRATGTRYPEDLVLRLMAVQRLRQQGMPLRAIKSELRRMSTTQVAAFVGVPLAEERPREPPESPAPPAPDLTLMSR